MSNTTTSPALKPWLVAVPVLLVVVTTPGEAMVMEHRNGVRALLLTVKLLAERLAGET